MRPNIDQVLQHPFFTGEELSTCKLQLETDVDPSIPENQNNPFLIDIVIGDSKDV